jgi:hypothetical protein
MKANSIQILSLLIFVDLATNIASVKLDSFLAMTRQIFSIEDLAPPDGP